MDRPEPQPGTEVSIPADLPAPARADGTVSPLVLGLLVPALLVPVALAGAPVRAAGQAADPDRLAAHTFFLAHDRLEGRGAATRGEAVAGLYLAAGLRALGLETVPGAAGYRLPVHLVAYVPDPAAEATVRIRTDDDVRTLRSAHFYHPGGETSSFRSFAGDLVVAGPTPDALAALDAAPGPDVRDRVVVVGPPWTGIDSVEQELARRGAAGVIEVVPSDFYHRLRVVRGPVRFALDRAPSDPPDLPRIVVGPEGIDALGLTGELRPARATSAHVEVTFAFHSERRTSHNVAGLLPGSDPHRAHEVVVVMAHYDHVTGGVPEDGDSIWNGFADNATGTATTLELARLLAADPPARSVLFLFTTAEEQGLLGATAFIDDPPVPTSRIVAALNLDGAAPPADIAAWNLAAPEGAVRERTRRALAVNGDSVDLRPVIADSDHWAFHRRGVPALFLYPGDMVDGVRPHSPHDEWRPDFPFAGLARYVLAARRVVRALADLDPPTETPPRTPRPTSHSSGRR